MKQVLGLVPLSVVLFVSCQATPPAPTNQSSSLTVSSLKSRLPVLPKVVTGFGGSMMLRLDGTVWAWGVNAFGQLGDDSDALPVRLPTPIPDLHDIVDVAMGCEHALALKSDGTVLSWGSNRHGQLGDGGPIRLQSLPVTVRGASSIVAVAAGCDHSLALRSDGRVLSWGKNSFGQLGVGSTVDRLEATLVEGATSITAIAAGQDHSLALNVRGTMLSWGRDSEGQLGNGGSDNPSNSQAKELFPVGVLGASDIASIGAGGWHSFAVTKTGALLTWGFNNRGQLGHGFAATSSLPVPVFGIGPVVAATGGLLTSFALNANGTVSSWGDNNDGQLGRGQSVDTLVSTPHPSRLRTLTNVVQIAASVWHTLALKSDGTVLAWGNDYYGQLGDDLLTINRSAPVLVDLGSSALSFPMFANPPLK
jgi:alpha-tubulin suppressor-like RCC1 family protein